MSKEAFQKIKIGLEEALEYARADPGAWSAEERWDDKGVKSWVVHNGWSQNMREFTGSEEDVKWLVMRLNGGSE